MTTAESLLTELGLDQLTRDARLRLVHELIDSLGDRADRPDRAIEVPSKLKQELRQRIEECNRSPEALLRWTELKQQIQESSDD